MNFKGKPRILICLMSLLLVSAENEKSTFKRIVIFGDSLSDDGIDTRKDLHGFGRQSNGPIWPEYLGALLGLEGEREPYSENYAYHGAKSGFDNYHSFGNWSGVLWQVDKYFCVYDTVPFDTLIALQVGGLCDLSRGSKDEAQVSSNTRKALDLLAAKGADTILVLNLLDTNKVPGYIKRADGYLLASSVSVANNLIKAEVDEFSAANPEVNIKLLDLSAIWYGIEQKFGKKMEVFPSWDQPYWSISKDYAAEYMWFNEYQPTTGVHKLIADKAYELLDQ